MKNVKNLIVAAIAGAALFIGCKKDDSLLATSATASANKTAGVNLGGFLHYNVATIGSAPGDMVTFKAGSINAVTMRLNATWKAGNALKLTTNEQPVTVNQWALYAPIDLGAVNLQEGSYNAFTFQIDLLPQGKIELRQQGEVFALTLDGNYMAYSDPNRVRAKTTAYVQRAVHIQINNAVTLSGEYALPLLITSPNLYTVTFNINPRDLMTGITQDMLDHATLTNGGIIISQDSNPSIYKQILLNLSGNLRVTLEVKNPLTSV